jgi:hypothetical protein
MNKRQKLVQAQFLNNEEAVIRRLKSIYSASQKDIEKKAQALQDDINRLGTMAKLSVDADEKAQLLSMQQSKIYQKQYQDAMKKQIGSILDNMQVEEFKTVSEYLQKCYEDGFVGTMFDLQGQGIPLCFPMDQEAMVRAVQLDSKISQGLYSRLGEDVALLKKKITAQVSRGIATGRSFEQVARQLSGISNIGFNNAVRIARTEGHRIQVQSGMDACYKAKEKGADVVKQWDSTLDDSTRESHAAVDGEIRELDEKFSNGLMFPGDPSGGAAEVVNCRCALLQRARWALDEEELKVLQDRASFYGLDKADTFDDYKKKYMKATKTAPTEYMIPKDLTAKEAEVFGEIQNTYNELYQKYGVSVDLLGDKIAIEQRDWDNALNFSVNEYLQKHPTVGRKRAETYVKKGMYPRPEKADIFLGGEYWDDAPIVTKDGAFERVKKITVNKFESGFDMTFKEGEEYVIAKLERRAARLAQGKRARALSNATQGGTGTILHEYGHALDYAKGIENHPKFKEWYSTLTEEEIENGLSGYATTNAKEFIAEAFAESFYSYQRPLSKKFMQILEEILND